MIYAVRLYGDPVLRRKAKPVREEEFGDRLREIAESMLETMYHHNGVGLAGPQVGLLKRIFVAIEIPDTLRGGNRDDEDDEPLPEDASREQKRERWGVSREHVMINPEIIKREGLQHGSDGCLSAPGIFYADMPRDDLITVRYQDVEGTMHELEATGFFSHVIQHEYDHLEGEMFFDRLSPDERRTFLQEHREEFGELQRDSKDLLKSLASHPEQTPRL